MVASGAFCVSSRCRITELCVTFVKVSSDISEFEEEVGLPSS